jgi:hypothetical protein
MNNYASTDNNVLTSSITLNFMSFLYYFHHCIHYEEFLLRNHHLIKLALPLLNYIYIYNYGHVTALGDPLAFEVYLPLVCLVYIDRLSNPFSGSARYVN